MSNRADYDWDPRSAAVRDDQIAAYDALRGRCPVAHGTDGSWTVLGHADTVAILDDPATFANGVSTHLSVPNGMDGTVHGAYRAIIDRYFLPEAIDRFAPVCRTIAHELTHGLNPPAEVEVVSALAEPFAAGVACAFMGWPAHLHDPLREWIRANHRATRAGDRAAMAAVAQDFEGHIRAQLDARRALGDRAPDDVTTRLLGEMVDGRALTDDEIISIARNWTAGELGTMSACVGIAVDFLVRHPDIQMRLRAGGTDGLFDAVTDEALRIHPPLISSRRRTTRPVTVAGRHIPAGERITVLWASANRDERVFGDPDQARLDRDPADNLLYGRGVHVCPGASLARLELRTILGELLDATNRIEPAPGAARPLASPPGSGFTSLSVRIS